MSYHIFDEPSLRTFASRIKTAVIAHIPTKTSQLTNDSGFVTRNDISTSGGTIVSNTAPTGNASTLWIDTGNGGIAKYWNGSAWVAVKSVWG